MALTKITNQLVLTINEEKDHELFISDEKKVLHMHYQIDPSSGIVTSSNLQNTSQKPLAFHVKLCFESEIIIQVDILRSAIKEHFLMQYHANESHPHFQFLAVDGNEL